MGQQVDLHAAVRHVFAPVLTEEALRRVRKQASLVPLFNVTETDESRRGDAPPHLKVFEVSLYLHESGEQRAPAVGGSSVPTDANRAAAAAAHTAAEAAEAAAAVAAAEAALEAEDEAEAADYDAAAEVGAAFDCGAEAESQAEPAAGIFGNEDAAAATAAAIAAAAAAGAAAPDASASASVPLASHARAAGASSAGRGAARSTRLNARAMRVEPVPLDVLRWELGVRREMDAPGGRHITTLRECSCQQPCCSGLPCRHQLAVWNLLCTARGLGLRDIQDVVRPEHHRVRLAQSLALERLDRRARARVAKCDSAPRLARRSSIARHVHAVRAHEPCAQPAAPHRGDLRDKRARDQPLYRALPRVQEHSPDRCARVRPRLRARQHARKALTD